MPVKYCLRVASNLFKESGAPTIPNLQVRCFPGFECEYTPDPKVALVGNVQGPGIGSFHHSKVLKHDLVD